MIIREKGKMRVVLAPHPCRIYPVPTKNNIFPSRPGSSLVTGCQPVINRSVRDVRNYRPIHFC